MRNNPRQYRPRQRKQGGGGLLSALASASMGAPSEANQMVPADIMATPAEPLPMGYEGPVNAPTPYTGPAMYYSDNGQIVDQPFSDRRSWFDKFRGVPDSAGQANFQIQNQVAQQRALAPLELADAQESMRALAKVRQELHPQELAMQKAELDSKAAQERLNAEAKLKQDRALGVAATPNEGFNSKNPGDVDFNYKGDPSEILDQPFIPYGQGAFDNQKYRQQNTANKTSEQAFADRPIINPLSLGDGSGSSYNNRFLNTTPGGIDANSRIASNQLAQKQIESQIADRNEPKIMQVGGNIIAIGPDGKVDRLASGNEGKVVEEFDMASGKMVPRVIGQSFQNYKPRPVGNVYRGANSPLEIDGGHIAQKYSGQTQDFPTGPDNTSVQTSQGGAPKTPPPRITELEGPALEGAIPDYLRKKKQQATVVYDAAGRAIQTMRTDAQKKWEEEQQRLRDIFSPYIRVAPKK